MNVSIHINGGDRSRAVSVELFEPTDELVNTLLLIASYFTEIFISRTFCPPIRLSIVALRQRRKPHIWWNFYMHRKQSSKPPSTWLMHELWRVNFMQTSTCCCLTTLLCSCKKWTWTMKMTWFKVHITLSSII